MPEKIAAIVEAAAPENVTELRAYLGIINYYHSFLPNIASICGPLHELLEK
jgi:hypothetical protein